MASTYSSYKFELIGTGDQAGTWGTTTNTNLGTTIEQAIGGYVSVALAGLTTTLTLTNSNAIQDARALYLNLTGAPGGAAVLEVPAIQKAYIIKNATTGGFTVTAKVTGLTGVDIPNGKTMLVYNNGTDVVLANDNFSAPVTINVNSASDALRINQIGAGNALVVEDSTNPDATPLVVNASGVLVTGSLVAGTVESPQGGASMTSRVQVQGTTLATAAQALSVWNVTPSISPSSNFAKSRGATVGDYTAVVAGDALGYITWQGAEGSTFSRSADIRALVEGTVAAGVVPGALVFRTANAAGVLTQRFIAASDGNFGFGIGAQANVSFNLGKSLTGSAANAYGYLLSANIAVDVTGVANGFYSQLATDASVILTDLYHFRAAPSAFGGGSTVTNQYGFSANNINGATNNFCFYHGLNAATGRWGFYGGGTAANAFAGLSRFGGVTAPVSTVDVTGSVGATTTILSSGPTSGVGYGTGAGGTVTQITSRTTPVTLNKTTGAITLVSAAGSATYQSFTVTNSAVAATDVIIVNQKSGTDKYIIMVTAVAAGSFNITFATTGGTTTEQPVFNFAVIKGVAA